MVERIKYDKATQRWFNSHPFAETTVMRCEDCKLHYKPELGHKCRVKRTQGQNVALTKNEGGQYETE